MAESLIQLSITWRYVEVNQATPLLTRFRAINCSTQKNSTASTNPRVRHEIWTPYCILRCLLNFFSTSVLVYCFALRSLREISNSMTTCGICHMTYDLWPITYMTIWPIPDALRTIRLPYITVPTCQPALQTSSCACKRGEFRRKLKIRILPTISFIFYLFTSINLRFTLHFSNFSFHGTILRDEGSDKLPIMWWSHGVLPPNWWEEIYS